MTTESPLVSIVLRTRNEASRIEYCLKSCRHQTYKSIEIIVVDNKSTDQTKDIAHRFTDLVFDKGPERIAQGNYGMIHIAKGEFVMYIDADMILEPNLIKSAVDYMCSSQLAGVYVNEIVLGSGFWGKLRRYERSFYNATCIDAARFLRRDLVVALGGFDEVAFPTPSAEDWDLDRRVATLGEIRPLHYLPSPPELWDDDVRVHVETRMPFPVGNEQGLYHDEADVSPKVYLKKKTYYARTMLAYQEKWGHADPLVQQQFGFKYRIFGVFIEDGKWKKLLRQPVLAAGMIGFRVIVGICYVANFKRKSKRDLK